MIGCEGGDGKYAVRILPIPTLTLQKGIHRLTRERCRWSAVESLQRKHEVYDPILSLLLRNDYLPGNDMLTKKTSSTVVAP